ncbi:hypothetical protein GTW51_22855 [Aurantimonas aggregata]|uniref:DUF1468 domain-containing protein n=1 Tax=Aurantimonas aggregata TaxID=2047720 RepID=A0A6L9MP22_9HYPH|nr:tripartite tricarboxylate transporter TctB family protein [Aurantimonas aggregata]NDV89485.1 hypothetical protein [Aurantimonas aggregata]
MTDKSRDLLTGTVLLILALAWMLMVWRTIPAGAGGGDVGPRAFPFLLGGLLALFSAVMVATALRRSDEETATAHTANLSDGEIGDGGGTFTPVPLLLTFGHLIAYGFLMQLIGFVLATLVTVASIMIVCANDRSPLRIFLMSIGVTFGCWLIFGKILGVYLATGSWINLG